MADFEPSGFDKRADGAPRRRATVGASAIPVDFSVIVPTFRRPRELAEALASVLNQEGVTVEAIVVDDSPEGSAREIVEGVRSGRVKYVHNPQPTGGVPSVVRNLGWPHAQGDFIHFLDDDDRAPEGHYSAAKEALTSHPEVGLVFGRIEPFGDCSPDQLMHERHFFADAARRASACERFGPRWAFAGQMLFDKALLVCSAAVLRRECVAALSGFDPEIRLMEDSDFFLRTIRQFGAHFMDRIALHYRIGSPSLLHAPNPDASQRLEQARGRRRMRAKYLKERGALEFLSLAVFARTVLKVA
jgi:glycosyltransferase involved in cell wall biosynthesis